VGERYLLFNLDMSGPKDEPPRFSRFQNLTDLLGTEKTIQMTVELSSLVKESIQTEFFLRRKRPSSEVVRKPETEDSVSAV